MNKTTTGDVGTTSYKAPEVSKGSYDQSADVYSFGITMWELLYKKRRYTELLRKMRKKDTNLGVSDLRAYMTDNAALLCTPKLTGGFGEAIDTLIEKCTNPNPQARPSMNSVVEELIPMTISRKTARQMSKLHNHRIVSSEIDSEMDSQ